MPVIGCIILTAYVVIMGMGRIYYSAVQWMEKADLSAKAAKTIKGRILDHIGESTKLKASSLANSKVNNLHIYIIILSLVC